MAIYHLTVDIISRGRGQSAVAAAAYRSGVTLRDHHYGVTHSHAGKRGVVHAQILAPADAPAWARDREVLWNRVEGREPRKDSQLARLIEVGLPVELSADERVALLRDYIDQQFVEHGMVADLSVRGEARNPHAHIMLTLRGLTPSGFGPKERGWNGKSVLLKWRAAWAAVANEHLARAGHAVRIDHRTLEAQQIELTPGRRMGVARARHSDDTLPEHLTDRIARQQRIAHENGEIILEDPTVALRALTQQRPIFGRRELAQFLTSRTNGSAQFSAAMHAVLECTDCVALEPQAGTEGRFTSRDMIEAEASLMRRAVSMAERRGHGVAPDRQRAVAAQFAMGTMEEKAFEYLASDGDAKAIVLDQAARQAVLPASRAAWGSLGLSAAAVAHTETAASLLETLSGIGSQSLASWEEAGEPQRGLTRESVLLVDGCHLMGLKQLERLVAAADKARAKVVLMAEPNSLKAMKVEPPFAGVWQRIGGKH